MQRKINWLKNLLQWGTLAAIVGFVVYGLTLGEKPADVEAYCPFGGLQALGSYLVNNSLACTMSMTQCCTNGRQQSAGTSIYKIPCVVRTVKAGCPFHGLF